MSGASGYVHCKSSFVSNHFSLLRLLAEEIINIIDHDVYTLFRQAISSFQHQQYKQSGEFTGQIVGILLQPGNDFHNSALLKNGLLGLSLN